MSARPGDRRPDDDAHARARTTPPHTLRRWPLPQTRSDAVDALVARLDAGDAAAAEDFASRLAREGTPLIEPDAPASGEGGGEGGDPAFSRYTFVWRGEAPHGVVLQLNRIADPLDPADTALDRIGSTDLHALTLRLPSNWQGSYLFVPLPHAVAPTLHGGPDEANLRALAMGALTDPWARERMPSKPVLATAGRAVPEYAVARGPAARGRSLWREDPAGAEHLGDLASPTTGAGLGLWRWSDPRADADSPVVLLADGEVWRAQFPLAPELAARRSAGAAPPVHLLFLDSGGPHQRERDYSADARETGELLRSARLLAGGLGERRWIVAGQSFGGLFALLAATRHPDVVRAAIAQSPSLWWPTPTDPWTEEDGWFEEQGRADGGAPVLLESGALDWGVAEHCRSAAAVLAARGALIDHRRHPGGHDVLLWQSSRPDLVLAAIAATSPD
jgi:pimeloyl-ACP methyl ester carboxylesterase